MDPVKTTPSPGLGYAPGLSDGGQVEDPPAADRTGAGNMDPASSPPQYKVASSGHETGVSNANGSPCIAPPSIAMSAEDMAAQLASLTSKTKDGQMAAAVNGLERSKQQMANRAQEGIAKIKEWEANTIEAAAKAKEAAETSWFEKIGNAIVGVVLTVVTAPLALTGVGTPLFAMALGMAIDGCTACVNNSRALETPPRDPIESFGNPLNRLMTEIIVGPTKRELEAAEKDEPRDEDKIKQLKAKGAKLTAESELITALGSFVTNPTILLMNPGIVGTVVGQSARLDQSAELAAAQASGDEAKVAAIEENLMKWEMGGAIAGTVIVAIGGIAATIMSGGAAAGVMVSNMAKIGTAAGEIAMAGVNIAKSGLAIETSHLQFNAAEFTQKASYAQADVAKLDAKKLMIQKFMEENQEDVKKLVQELMENAILVSQMINSASSTRSVINANLAAGKLNPA